MSMRTADCGSAKAWRDGSESRARTKSPDRAAGVGLHASLVHPPTKIEKPGLRHGEVDVHRIDGGDLGQQGWFASADEVANTHEVLANLARNRRRNRGVRHVKLASGDFGLGLFNLRGRQFNVRLGI